MNLARKQELEQRVHEGKGSGDAQESLVYEEVDCVLNWKDKGITTASVKDAIAAMDRLIAAARGARTALRRSI